MGAYNGYYKELESKAAISRKGAKVYIKFIFTSSSLISTNSSFFSDVKSSLVLSICKPSPSETIHLHIHLSVSFGSLFGAAAAAAFLFCRWASTRGAYSLNQAILCNFGPLLLEKYLAYQMNTNKTMRTM